MYALRALLPLRAVMPYAGPTSWNSLPVRPDSLKDINLTLQTFKRHLKTLLFFRMLAHSVRLRFLTKKRNDCC